MSKTIIAAIDFSDVTQTVLEETIKFARALNTSITLIHVFHYISDTILDDTGMIPSDYETKELLEKVSQKDLQEAKKQIEKAGVECESCFLYGSPSFAILEYITQEHPEMVTIGSHGHGAFYHLVLGSVSEKVVDKATCSVLIVKKPVV